jgi:hypothetical protein
MPSDRTIICASVFAACLVGFGTFFYTLSPLVSAPRSPAASLSPPSADRPLNYGRESDGFPLETTPAQALVNVCARVHHVNPFGTITAKQVEGVTTCVDLIRSGRVTLN